MSISLTRRTLFEDWQERRSHLADAGGGGLESDPRIKVLDYLLSRYRDSTVAQRPARFPLPAKLVCDDRRIIVHHHLGRGQIAGVQSAREADSRMAGLVQRMHASIPAESEEQEETHQTQKRPGSAKPLSLLRAFFTTAKDRRSSAKAVSNWRVTAKKIRKGRTADPEIQAALNNCQFLPIGIVQHLVARLCDISNEDTRALELLSQCQNRGICEHAVEAWTQRVIHGMPQDEIRKGLEKYLRRDERREATAERMRETLAHEHPKARLAALAMLGELGNLDDIGLLSDLLLLPCVADEMSKERKALVRTMRQLAEGSDGAR